MANQPKWLQYCIPVPGDVLAIPLPGSQYAFARVYRDADVGIYKCLANEIVDVEFVRGHPIAFFCSPVGFNIKQGKWPIIGRHPFAKKSDAWSPPVWVEYPIGRTGYKIYHKGRMRPATQKETHGLEEFCFVPDNDIAPLIFKRLGVKHPPIDPTVRTLSSQIAGTRRKGGVKKKTANAWKAGSFENDPAADWLDELLNGDDLSPIAAAFEAAEECAADYIEVDTGSAAIAAAEVVAALSGRPSPKIPLRLKKWLRERRTGGARLRGRALRAVELILADNSEVKQLWLESGHLAQWLRAVRGLQRRLK